MNAGRKAARNLEYFSQSRVRLRRISPKAFLNVIANVDLRPTGNMAGGFSKYHPQSMSSAKRAGFRLLLKHRLHRAPLLQCFNANSGRFLLKMEGLPRMLVLFSTTKIVSAARGSRLRRMNQHGETEARRETDPQRLRIHAELNAMRRPGSHEIIPVFLPSSELFSPCLCASVVNLVSG